jgi:hypothetical protein
MHPDNERFDYLHGGSASDGQRSHDLVSDSCLSPANAGVYEPKLLARSRHDAPECNTQTMPLREYAAYPHAVHRAALSKAMA